MILPSGQDYWTIRARRESAYSRLRASGGDMVPLTTEFIAVRRDGTELPVEATLADLHDPDGGYRVFAVLGDLTERRQAEAQARVLQKSEALGTLIAGVAHDFNNILTIISGSLAAADKNSPDHDRWIEIGQRSTDRAIALVASLLRFARRSPGTMAPFDLSATARDVVKMLHETLERRITLEDAAIESDLPPVTGDQNELQQVLMNLVLNARDAVLERADGPDPDLQPTIEIRVERAIKHGLPAEQVEVRDNGGGIPPANLERVFDPFFTTKPVGKGTGLGLSMAHSIIQNHGGEISIDSQVGVGTTIRFWLPTEVDADFVAASLPAAAPRLGPVTPPPGAEDWRVLVVDDEPHLLELARFVFAGTGATVTTAEDALAALATVESATFDVAIVDVNMPGIDGWQLLERLREIAPDLPVVVVSGYLDALDLRNHRPAAALSKPYEAQMLIETVRRVIEEQRSRD